MLRHKPWRTPTAGSMLSEGDTNAGTRAFLTMAHEPGVDASDCLFVGDYPAHDIAGARSAGMHGLLINHYAEEAVGMKTAVLARIMADGDAR